MGGSVPAEPVELDLARVHRALRVLHEPGDVVEVRALDVRRPSGRFDKTVSGYFDDFRLAAKAACQLSGCSTGVYMTFNECDPSLLARRANRIDAVGPGDTTSNHDIVRRRWLLVDVDSKRPAKISATDDEVRMALELRNDIVVALCAEGWPEPVLADSGNGGHALWRIDLPSEDDKLVERVLKSLAARFDRDKVKVDTGVHNAARITKLYGTLARKGDQTEDRRWRWSGITDAPTAAAVVPLELLEAIGGKASSLPQSEKWDAADRAANAGSFDLRAFVARHLTVLKDWRTDGRGRELVEVICPFNDSHAGGETVIGVASGGGYFFKCWHNGCSDMKWQDVRAMFEPRSSSSAGPATKADAPKAEPGTFERELEDALADVQNALGAKNHKERAPLFQDAAELFLRDYPPAQWLVTGLVTKGGIAMLGAEPKSGKTWMATEIAVAVTTGTPVCGEFFAERGRVAYFFAEDLAVQVRNRIRALLAGRELGPIALGGRLHVCPRGKFLDITDDKDLAWVIASCRRLGELDLLVLDPLRDLHSGEEDKSDAMRDVMRRLRLVGELLGCTVAVAHHSGKASVDNAKRRPGQRMRGSGAIHGSTDSGIYLGVKGGDGVARFELDVESEVKGARSAGHLNLALDVEDDEQGTATKATWTRYEPDEKSVGPGKALGAELAIAAFLGRSDAAMSRSAISTALNLRKRDALAAVETLIADGRVVEVRGRKVGGCWPLWTIERASDAGVDVVPTSQRGQI
jgi:AAA domain